MSNEGSTPNISVEEAAAAFGISVETLRENPAAIAGILSIADVGRTLGIKYDTIWSAANPKNKNKKSKFDSAVLNKSGGTRYINILHPDFVRWFREDYKPHNDRPKVKPEPHPCKLNEVEGRTYADKDGVLHVVQHCDKIVPHGTNFCSIGHFREHRSATGGWAAMGKMGNPNSKGTRGPRKTRMVAEAAQTRRKRVSARTSTEPIVPPDTFAKYAHVL
jgi:hypothetical protein